MSWLKKPKKCSCGSGQFRRELTDARGIFIAYVCDKCEGDAKQGYRPEIFTNSQYQADEQIEPDPPVAGLEHWDDLGRR